MSASDLPTCAECGDAGWILEISICRVCCSAISQARIAIGGEFRWIHHQDNDCYEQDPVSVCCEPGWSDDPAGAAREAVRQ